MKEWFPGKQPEDFGPYAGIAQQYLFHYIRTTASGAVCECVREGKRQSSISGTGGGFRLCLLHEITFGRSRRM